MSAAVAAAMVGRSLLVCCAVVINGQAECGVILLAADCL